MANQTMKSFTLSKADFFKTHDVQSHEFTKLFHGELISKDPKPYPEDPLITDDLQLPKHHHKMP